MHAIRLTLIDSSDMAAVPPPEGMTEDDYDSIHAAVVETVRGRWFLTEYARRSRVDEVREMLDAIGRLEAVVTSQKALPPPSSDTSPHQRLLAQRAGEIAACLAGITDDLREGGADPYLCDDLETQIRAIAGLTKGTPAPAAPAIQPVLAPEARPALAAPEPRFRENALEILSEDLPATMSVPTEVAPEPRAQPIMPSMPRATPLQVSAAPSTQGEDDPRLAALAALDRLSLAEKLALFS